MLSETYLDLYKILSPVSDSLPLLDLDLAWRIFSAINLLPICQINRRVPLTKRTIFFLLQNLPKYFMQHSFVFLRENKGYHFLQKNCNYIFAVLLNFP